MVWWLLCEKGWEKFGIKRGFSGWQCCIRKGVGEEGAPKKKSTGEGETRRLASNPVGCLGGKSVEENVVVRFIIIIIVVLVLFLFS